MTTNNNDNDNENHNNNNDNNSNSSNDNNNNDNDNENDINNSSNYNKSTCFPNHDELGTCGISLVSPDWHSSCKTTVWIPMSSRCVS